MPSWTSVVRSASLGVAALATAALLLWQVKGRKSSRRQLPPPPSPVPPVNGNELASTARRPRLTKSRRIANGFRRASIIHRHLVPDAEGMSLSNCLYEKWISGKHSPQRSTSHRRFASRESPQRPARRRSQQQQQRQLPQPHLQQEASNQQQDWDL